MQHPEAKYQFVQRDGGWYHDSMPVDPNQGFKAKEIQLRSFTRPHMCAFHLSWISFFMSFLCWFAFAPLMSTVRTEFGMTPRQVYVVGVASVASTVFARILAGPLCDKLGPKRCQVFLLAWMSFFVFLSPLVKDMKALAMVRFAIGFGGATFVVAQYWSTQMFASEIVGLANATTAGWGNLGGGAAQILMGWLFFAFSKVFSISKAWRMSMLVPAFVTSVLCVLIYFISDDSPLGDHSKLHAANIIASNKNSWAGFANMNSWILGMQYGCCFGVELHVNNSLAFYLANNPTFECGVLDAATIASLFGLMNIFARSGGGWASDCLALRLGMRGRMIAQLCCLCAEGVCLVIFARQTTIPTLIPALLVFSLFTQASEGTTFAIVPYVVPTAVGGVCAVVAAWGNIGAVCCGLLFIFGFPDQASDGFATLGFIVIAFSSLTFGLSIRGQSDLMNGGALVPNYAVTIPNVGRVRRWGGD